MGEYLTTEKVQGIFNAAIDAGWYPESIQEPGRRPRLKRSIRWPVHGKCLAPVEVTYWSRYSVSTKRKEPLSVVMTTKCRKCTWCLMTRRHHWADLACREVITAPRTWFITLTMRPEEHYRLLTSTRAAVADYDSLPPDKRFRELLRSIRPCMRGGLPPPSYGRELTLFIKRIRKNSGTNLRYLAVAEKHTGGGMLDGFPHFHMLLHEVEVPIRKSVIKAAWHLGHSDVKLCEGTRGAVYLCKYLAKDASTRVRASFKYGKRIGLPQYADQHSRQAWTDIDPQSPSPAPRGMGPVSSEERSDGLRNGGTPAGICSFGPENSMEESGD